MSHTQSVLRSGVIPIIFCHFAGTVVLAIVLIVAVTTARAPDRSVVNTGMATLAMVGRQGVAPRRVTPDSPPDIHGVSGRPFFTVRTAIGGEDEEYGLYGLQALDTLLRRHEPSLTQLPKANRQRRVDYVFS